MEKNNEVEKNVKKKKKRLTAAQRKKRRIIFIVVDIILLLIIAVVVFIAVKFGRMGQVEYNQRNVVINEGITEKTGYTTFALFGLDSREVGKLGKGAHSDCIIIASINNATHEVKLASVYRDTYLNVGKNGEDYYFKSNQAYFLGGPEQAVSMLNKNLDLNIKDYFTVDFKALSKAIDMLGGIELYLTAEEAHQTNLYALDTGENIGEQVYHIREIDGTVTLNGINATSYARVRYTAGDDYKRTERQRIVIEATLEKAKQTDILTLNSIIDEVLPLCATSLDATKILGIAAQLTSFTMGEAVGFPFDKRAGIICGAAGDCVVAEGLMQNVEQLHEFLYPDMSYTPSDAVKKINDKIIAETGVAAAVKKESSSSSSASKASSSSATSKTTSSSKSSN